MTHKRDAHAALIVQISTWLFFSAAVFGYFILDRKSYPLARDYAISLGPVASATLIYLAISFGIRELHAPGRLVFPLNLTLPLIFVMLIRVAVILWTSPTGAAFRTPEALAPALIWTNPLALTILALVQIGLLSGLSMVWRQSGK